MSDTGEKIEEYNGTVHQLFINFTKICDSEVLYNIFTEFGMPTKLVRLVKMCLNETYNKVCRREHLSDACPIQNGLKQRDTAIAFQLCFRIRHLEGS
jgi:hypothetical protein